jgi:hypothetical protein
MQWSWYTCPHMLYLQFKLLDNGISQKKYTYGRQCIKKRFRLFQIPNGSGYLWYIH